MQLLISDSNVLIDLIVVNQIENMFKLPYSFAVPDILFYSELEEDHADLLNFGLETKPLIPETIDYFSELVNKYNKPGKNDLFALALAKQESCPLLTGDLDLRNAAESESIVRYGTIWIIEQLIVHDFVNIDDARNLYDEMKNKKRRLPWALAEASLIELSKRK